MDNKEIKTWIKPIVLEGEHIRLRPLDISDIDAIKDAASDGELWRLWFTSVPTEQETLAYIRLALHKRDIHNEMPFVVIHKETEKLIGMTRFCNVDQQNKRPEIGYTWYAQSYQKSPVNTECKLLLLQHVFETLDAIAVEFRTHWFNFESRKSIARIGAKQDGVLRSHIRSPDGILRDSVVFSILQSEWLAVKQNLLHKLQKIY